MTHRYGSAKPKLAPVDVQRMVAWPAAAVPTILALRDIAPQWTAAFAFLGLAAAGFAFAASFDRRRSPVFGVPWQPLMLDFALVAMLLFAVAHGVLGNETVLGLGLLFTSAALAGIALLRSAESAAAIVRVAGNALGLLVVAATLLWMLGVESLTVRGSPLVSDLRVLFPLTFGYTNHAAVCGATLVMWAPRFREGWRVWPVLACCVVGMILSDGRTAMFAAAAVIAGLRFVPRHMLPGGALALPVSAALFLVAVETVPQSWLRSIARTGDVEEILSGNNRVKVWSEVVEAVEDDPVSFTHGYGFYGQAASGISQSYARVFKGWNGDLRFYSVHNAGMQLLVDGGLFALVVFVAWYAWMLQIFADHRLVPAVNLAIYVLMVGTMDMTGTPLQREVFYALLLLTFAAMRYCVSRSPSKRRWRHSAYGRYGTYPYR